MAHSGQGTAIGSLPQLPLSIVDVPFPVFSSVGIEFSCLFSISSEIREYAHRHTLAFIVDQISLLYHINLSSRDIPLCSHAVDQPIIEGSYVGKSAKAIPAATFHTNGQYSSKGVRSVWAAYHQQSSWVRSARFFVLSVGSSTQHPIWHNCLAISYAKSFHAVSMRHDRELTKEDQHCQLSFRQLWYIQWRWWNLRHNNDLDLLNKRYW